MFHNVEGLNVEPIQLVQITFVSILLFYLSCLFVLKGKYRLWYECAFVKKYNIQYWFQSHAHAFVPFYDNLHEKYAKYIDHCAVVVLSDANADTEKNGEQFYRKNEDAIIDLLHSTQPSSYSNTINTQIIPHYSKYNISPYLQSHNAPWFVGVSFSPITMSLQGVSINVPATLTIKHSTRPATHALYVNVLHATKDPTVESTLITTTEYTQKYKTGVFSSLYRFNYVPWFVPYFTKYHTYTFFQKNDVLTIKPNTNTNANANENTTIIKITKTNEEVLFQYLRETAGVMFLYTILPEFSHISHLIQTGVYVVYALLLNKTAVAGIYVFAESNKVCVHNDGEILKAAHYAQRKKERISSLFSHKQRIERLKEEHISADEANEEPVKNKLRRLHAPSQNKDIEMMYDKTYSNIVYARSSIMSKHLISETAFVNGFLSAVQNQAQTQSQTQSQTTIMIDTIGHNYKIINSVLLGTPVTVDTWYYVFHNCVSSDAISSKHLFCI